MSPEHLEHLNISKSASEHDETVAADALGDKYSSDGYYSCLEMSSWFNVLFQLYLKLMDVSKRNLTEHNSVQVKLVQFWF